jgi:hypothetical protein
MTSKRVFVSSAQKAAARAMVNRSAVTGRKVSASVRKIADAKAEPAKRKPPTTSAAGSRSSA